MFANELISFLKQVNFRRNFGGIFAADTVPKSLKKNHFIIVNLDPQHLPGSHWIGVVRLNNLVECFDSLGTTAEKQDFLKSKFVFRGVTHLSYNVTSVQPLTSHKCGEFVLYYLFERFHNLDLDFEELLNDIFTDNLTKNDSAVSDFISDQRLEHHGNSHRS